MSTEGEIFADIQYRVQAMGFDSIYSLMREHPGEPMGKVLRLIAKRVTGTNHLDIPFLFFEEAYLQEAVQLGRAREVAQDTLVRSLREHVRSGWNRGRRVHEKRAQAFARWRVPPIGAWEQIEEYCRRVWESLESIPPPDNWVPIDIDDELIQTAFNMSWVPGQ